MRRSVCLASVQVLKERDEYLRAHTQLPHIYDCDLRPEELINQLSNHSNDLTKRPFNFFCQRLKSRRRQCTKSLGLNKSEKNLINKMPPLSHTFPTNWTLKLNDHQVEEEFVIKFTARHLVYVFQ